MKLVKNQKGDTIVEVLISIVIIALILTGAYETANASLKSIIDSQERTQALGYAQDQVEDLRTEAAIFFDGGTANSQYSIPTPGDVFCFNSTATPVGYTTTGAVPASCQQTTGGTTYTAQIESQGKTSPTDPSITTYTFRINISWPSISVNATTDQINIYYRVEL